MAFILMTSCRNGGTFEKKESTTTPTYEIVAMDSGPQSTTTFVPCWHTQSGHWQASVVVAI